MAVSCKSVFVTVGTTSFDELIERVCCKEILQLLVEKGFTEINLQIGRGTYVPSALVSTNLRINHYRYKKSIRDDIKNASLVISHSGAGSILETLEFGAPLIAVINNKLHDNHQIELATKMSELGCLFCCTCRTLEETLQRLGEPLQPLQPGNPELFSNYLNKTLGFKT